MGRLSFDLDDEADLDRDTERKGGTTDGGAGVATGLTKDFDEKVGGAVDDLRVGGEVRLGIDEARDGDDAGDAVERAKLGFDHGEAGEEGGLGGFLSGFKRAFGGDFPKELEVTDDGEASGNVEEISGADGTQV